jgi:hypothetical protein
MNINKIGLSINDVFFVESKELEQEKFNECK